MNLDGFAIRTAFLVLPGLLASQLLRKFRGKTDKKAWEDFTEIIFTSLISYVLLAIFMAFSIEDWSLSFEWPALSSIDGFLDESKPIKYGEIVWATLIAVVLACMYSYFCGKRTFFRILNFFKITNRYGNEDVWSYFHSAKENPWLFIRDHKRNLIYYGYVKAFSETNHCRELLINDVSVHDSKGTKLYDTPQMYLSRDHHDLTLELLNSKSSTDKEH